MASYKCMGVLRGVCDYEAPERWFGRCPGCNRYYDIRKFGVEKALDNKSTLASLTAEKIELHKISTGIAEFDRILGGGLVADRKNKTGSSIMISGERGQGKSTLLIMTAEGVAQQGHTVLIASGEQAKQEIALYAQRLGVKSDKVEVMGVNEEAGDIEAVCERAEQIKASLIIIDSVQTAWMNDCKAAEGSTEQSNACWEYLSAWVKREYSCVMAVAHQNTTGGIAGGTRGEHLCDAIFTFNGYNPDLDPDMEDVEIDADTSSRLRVIECIGKNRFGDSGGFTVMKMTAEGLKPFSKLDLTQKPKRRRERAEGLHVVPTHPPFPLR